MEESILLKLHEGMVFLYMLSLLLYAFDFLQNNKKAKKSALSLLWVVWLLQTVFFILYIAEIGRFPILTMYEGLYFYGWLLITLSLTFQYLLTIDYITFFTNILGFSMTVIYTFAPVRWSSMVLAEKLVSELLIAHITLSILAYGAFSISFVFSILYLVQYRLLKQKRWGKRLLRMANLTKLDQFSFTFNGFGVMLLTIGVILGLQWAHVKIPNLSFLDWKIIGSLLVIMVYCIYFYGKTKKHIIGKNLALWNIASFLIVLINFFLLGKFSNFHLWYS